MTRSSKRKAAAAAPAPAPKRQTRGGKKKEDKEEKPPPKPKPAPKKPGAEDDGVADDKKGKKGRDGSKDGADKVAPRYKIRGSVEGVKGALKEMMDIVDREKRVEEVVMVQIIPLVL